MSWTTLTAENIKGRLAEDELEAYTQAGNPDTNGIYKIPEIIRQVTGMVRGKVATCRDNLNTMGPSGTIPEECLFAACTIARDALVGSLPLSEGATEVRKEELRQAYLFLDAIAACDVRIEDPGGVIPGTGPSIYPAYGGKPLLCF